MNPTIELAIVSLCWLGVFGAVATIIAEAIGWTNLTLRPRADVWARKACRDARQRQPNMAAMVAAISAIMNNQENVPTNTSILGLISVGRNP
jgi:hypothetical protein